MRIDEASAFIADFVAKPRVAATYSGYGYDVYVPNLIATCRFLRNLEADTRSLWHQLRDERNSYLKGVNIEVIECVKIGRHLIEVRVCSSHYAAAWQLLGMTRTNMNTRGRSGLPFTRSITASTRRSLSQPRKAGACNRFTYPMH
jgi:hypothetical protein